MKVFKRAPSIFALAALTAPALFAAPPAAAQDYRTITARAIAAAVSGMSEDKADPGPGQAGAANRASSQQASRQDVTPAPASAGQKTPKVAPAQP
jgi:hypothetical protein